MSFGILSGPGAFPRVSRLTHLLYIYRVNWVLISVLCRPFLLSMISLFVCHEYLRMAHMHVFGWSIVSSRGGACLWNDACWV